MHSKKSYIEQTKLFSNLSAIVFATWGTTFLISLGIGTIYFGHLPVYGDDKDPSSLNLLIIDILRWINFISFFFSFIAILAWPLLIIHLLINKVKFNRTDKLLQAFALLAIVLFFLLKYVWPQQFLWHSD